jgi:ATP-binding cassette subfamily D (ALD) long-chain fatty acid import protein
MKKHPSHQLTPGLADEGERWELVKIGTEEEKAGMEKEL